MAGMGGVAEYTVLNNTIIHWEDGGLFLLRPRGSIGGGVLGGKGGPAGVVWLIGNDPNLNSGAELTPV